jgi:hypothetical protein
MTIAWIMFIVQQGKSFNDSELNIPECTRWNGEGRILQCKAQLIL